MAKSLRQDKIKEIINTEEIDTQEELVEKLNSYYSFNVTQATVSRDIKELGLIKVSGNQKKYKYSIVKQDNSLDVTRFLTLFKSCVIKIEVAQNLVVIKTYAGNGNAIGAIVDKLSYKEIVGSVSGDDTLLVICKTNEDALAVKNQLLEML